MFLYGLREKFRALQALALLVLCIQPARYVCTHEVCSSGEGRADTDLDTSIGAVEFNLPNAGPFPGLNANEMLDDIFHAVLPVIWKAA